MPFFEGERGVYGGFLDYLLRKVYNVVRKWGEIPLKKDRY